MPGVVLVGAGRVRAVAAARGHGLHRIDADVEAIALGDVVGQQLRVQADMARRPHQVVVEGGGAVGAEAVTLDHALHDRRGGQIRHDRRQAVLHGDVDAITGSGAQHQRLDRYARLEFAGGRVEVGLAHVHDRGWVMQRPGLSADGEGLAILGVEHRSQGYVHGP
ncbi:hypothetical protein D3C76_624210 [compost metagenome]